WSAGRVGLFSNERGEDRLARVLLGPSYGETARTVLARVLEPAPGIVVEPSRVTRVVGLLHMTGRRVVIVGRPGEAELERIHQGGHLERDAEPILERAAHVCLGNVGQHFAVAGCDVLEAAPHILRRTRIEVALTAPFVLIDLHELLILLHE